MKKLFNHIAIHTNWLPLSFFVELQITAKQNKKLLCKKLVECKKNYNDWYELKKLTVTEIQFEFTKKFFKVFDRKKNSVKTLVAVIDGNESDSEIN